MDKKEIIVLDNVDIVSYSTAVNQIVSKFFDDEGNYTPHFGRMNSVGVFFNFFVDQVSLDNYFADSKDIEIELDTLLADEYCMSLYNQAMGEYKGYTLDFGNAFVDAMEIVHAKNTTIVGAVEMVRDSFAKLADKLNPIFSEDSINKLQDIADKVAKGDLSAGTALKALDKK